MTYSAPLSRDAHPSASAFRAELFKTLDLHNKNGFLKGGNAFKPPVSIMNTGGPSDAVRGVRIVRGIDHAASNADMTMIPGVIVGPEGVTICSGSGEEDVFLHVGGPHVVTHRGVSVMTSDGPASRLNVCGENSGFFSRDLSSTDPARPSWISELPSRNSSGVGPAGTPQAGPDIDLRKPGAEQPPALERIQRMEARLAALTSLAGDIESLAAGGHTQCRVRLQGDALSVEAAGSSAANISAADMKAYLAGNTYLRTLDIRQLPESDHQSEIPAALSVETLQQAVQATRNITAMSLETHRDLWETRHQRGGVAASLASPSESGTGLARPAPSSSELREVRARREALLDAIWDLRTLDKQVETSGVAHLYLRRRDGVWHLERRFLADDSDVALAERRQATQCLAELGMKQTLLTPMRAGGNEGFPARELSAAVQDLLQEKFAAYDQTVKEEEAMAGQRRSVNFSGVDDVRIFEKEPDAGTEDLQEADEGGPAGSGDVHERAREMDSRRAAATERAATIMRREQEKFDVEDARTPQHDLSPSGASGSPAGNGVPAAPPMTYAAPSTGSPVSSAAPGGPRPASTGSARTGGRARMPQVKRPTELPPPPPPPRNGRDASVSESSVSSAATPSRTSAAQSQTLQQEQEQTAATAPAPGIGRGVAALDVYTEEMTIHEDNLHELEGCLKSGSETFNLSNPIRKRALLGYLSPNRQVPREGYADAERKMTVEIRATPFSVIGADRVVEAGASPLKLVGLQSKKVILQQLPNREERLNALLALQSQLDTLPTDAEQKVYLKSDGGRNLRISDKPAGTVRALGGLLPGQSGSAAQAWSLLETLGVDNIKGRGAAIKVGELRRLISNAIRHHEEMAEAISGDDQDDIDAPPTWVAPRPPSSLSDDEGSEFWSDGESDDGVSVLDLRRSTRGSLSDDDGSIGGVSMNGHRIADRGFEFENVGDARRSKADGVEERGMSGNGDDVVDDEARHDPMPVFSTVLAKAPVAASRKG